MNLLERFYEDQKERNEVAKKYDDAKREYEEFGNVTISIIVKKNGEMIETYDKQLEPYLKIMCDDIMKVAEEKMNGAKRCLEELLGVKEQSNAVQGIEDNESDHDPVKQETEKQDKPWLDREKLYEEYITNGKTAKEIAEMWCTTKKNVGNALQRFGIKRNDFVPGKQDFSKKKVTP